MLRLRNLGFDLLFYLGSVPLILAALLESMLSQAGLVRGARRWSRYFLWCARVLLGIRYEVSGALPQHCCIVAMKHQSMFEAIALLTLFDYPAVVMKAELMRIPGWGHLARRHGSIPVAREASARALRQMMAAADAACAEGRPIVIFPEGTRVGYGEAPPIKPGVAGLYKLLKREVVPVALDSGRLWQRGRLRRPGRITIAVQPAIAPGLPRPQFETALHDAINRSPTC